MKKTFRYLFICMIIMMIIMLISSLSDIYYYGYIDAKVTTISSILSAILGLITAWKFHKDISGIGDICEIAQEAKKTKPKRFYLLFALAGWPIGLAACYYRVDYILLFIMIPVTTVLTIDLC